MAPLLNIKLRIKDSYITEHVMHVLNQKGYHTFLIYNSPLEDHINPKMPKRPLLNAILNVSLKQKMLP